LQPLVHSLVLQQQQQQRRRLAQPDSLAPVDAVLRSVHALLRIWVFEVSISPASSGQLMPIMLPLLQQLQR
jgi:hypothetical protein